MKTCTMIAAMLVALSGATAAPLTLVTSADAPRSVVFESDAPLEVIMGRTTTVSAEAVFDPDDLSAPCRIRAEVDLASLRTGLSTRDRHMREDHLHTDRHPAATLTVERLLAPSAAALAPGDTVTAVLAGVLDLHGVAAGREIPVRLVMDEHGQLLVTASFPVVLADHGIPRPEKLLLKLGEHVDVTVELLLAAP